MPIFDPLSISDDHGFSPLHWASKEGRLPIVEMLITRGARINASNMGDDTALHLAAAHGHRDVVAVLLKNKADVNAVNEHGNTPLHYACFWGYQDIAEDLIQAGCAVNIANKFNETAFDKCRAQVLNVLLDLAAELGQDTSRRINFKDQSWLGQKTRTRDATLSRHTGINMNDIRFDEKIAVTQSGETWRATWQGNQVTAKFLTFGESPSPDFIRRCSKTFGDEFPRLRIFSHPNVNPVIGCTNSPPNMIIVSQFMKYGSLYDALHKPGSIVSIDHYQALRFANDIARGMAFLHSLDPLIPRFYLNSHHVMIDDDMSAKINMADAKFSFQEKNKMYHPNWVSPEALQKKTSEINIKAADMWSFAILLWEMTTRQVPFGDMNPMEVGMKISLEDMRISIPAGMSAHVSRLIKICMNEEPGKRPSFDQVIPILDKMIH
jgi:integrin-linked kinase